MADEQADPLAALRAPLVYPAPGMDTVTARRSIAYRADAAAVVEESMGGSSAPSIL